jgi:hypothetical protein
MAFFASCLNESGAVASFILQSILSFDVSHFLILKISILTHLSQCVLLPSIRCAHSNNSLAEINAACLLELKSHRKLYVG